ncbi:prolipoprotein diacylglyceryl transferase [Paraurantiacibacter namhicola]|uniref:Phosphatidylglycerol--prolipoprotein diacylglyceryl transferase n=1 Tax=Paraurantiacibacter namhicola TaxID=645517 RepID=A0A1C7D679_9SPHN|nr:prolipoprotein diacylglyceryl transferase [Paraurantiacibacter namhicola]ANU06969.1 Prolipoprotein diacylglyceryl transferase [Paraurantiacibacter namhicola]
MLEPIVASAYAPIQWTDLGLKEGIDLGFFTLRYYSLAYLAGLVLAYVHLLKMIKAPGAPLAKVHAEDLFFYCTLGVILGGRFGYALFYKPELFTGWSGDGLVKWELLRLWDGGMSFHGGVIGVVLAIVWVTRRNDLKFLRVCDYIAVNVPFGMLFGRLANFVNGELWGRPAGPDVPWAMVFPDGGPVARHPSQLYQASMEGLLLMLVMLGLFWLTRARFRPGLLVGAFTAGMGTARFIGEFFRQPDAHLTEFAERSGLSMGQWLSLPMIVLGLGLVLWAMSRPALASGTKPRAKETAPA